MEEVKKPFGRPTIYTEELAQEICDTIATTTKGLKVLCNERDHWPEESTIRKWCINKADFFTLYMRARKMQIHWQVEKSQEIADDSSNDTIEDRHGNLRYNGEFVNRSRLRVENIRWIASKLLPNFYGDRTIVEAADPSKDKDLAAAREEAQRIVESKK